MIGTVADIGLFVPRVDAVVVVDVVVVVVVVLVIVGNSRLTVSNISS